MWHWLLCFDVIEWHRGAVIVVAHDRNDVIEDNTHTNNEVCKLVSLFSCVK